jgi:hypothetical protein
MANELASGRNCESHQFGPDYWKTLIGKTRGPSDHRIGGAAVPCSRVLHSVLVRPNAATTAVGAARGERQMPGVLDRLSN